LDGKPDHENKAQPETWQCEQHDGPGPDCTVKGTSWMKAGDQTKCRSKDRADQDGKADDGKCDWHSQSNLLAYRPEVSPGVSKITGHSACGPISKLNE
jgi:hypothetical protein